MNEQSRVTITCHLISLRMIVHIFFSCMRFSSIRNFIEDTSLANLAPKRNWKQQSHRKVRASKRMNKRITRKEADRSNELIYWNRFLSIASVCACITPTILAAKHFICLQDEKRQYDHQNTDNRRIVAESSQICYSISNN